MGVNGAWDGGGLFMEAEEPGFAVGDRDEAIERARKGRGALTEHGADDIAARCDVELGGLVGRNDLSGGEGADLVGLVSHADRRGTGGLGEIRAWGDGEEDLGRSLVGGGNRDFGRFGGLVLGGSHGEAKREGDDK